MGLFKKKTPPPPPPLPEYLKPTIKQLRYLAMLASERCVISEHEGEEVRVINLKVGPYTTASQVSKWIDWMQTLPFKGADG